MFSAGLSGSTRKFVATGSGAVSTYGDYTYHTFFSGLVQTFTARNGYKKACEILAVASNGFTGSINTTTGGGGGGGAGDILTNSFNLEGSYSVRAGLINLGSSLVLPTYFGSLLTPEAGGRGGTTTLAANSSEGSGGGGPARTNLALRIGGIGGTDDSPYAKNGGSGSGIIEVAQGVGAAGGGGGGAGSVGQNATSSGNTITGGAGGDGTSDFSDWVIAARLTGLNIGQVIDNVGWIGGGIGGAALVSDQEDGTAVPGANGKGATVNRGVVIVRFLT